MASVADLCNVALSHIGSAAVVTSISPPDGSMESGRCAVFYPIARTTALEQHPYSFAKKRDTLASVTNPSNVWLYAYALPSDCLRPLRVLAVSSAVTFNDALWLDDVTYSNYLDENKGAPFDWEGSVLLTNEPDATLLYTRDVTDTSKYTPMFNLHLTLTLGSLLAGPIIKGKEGMQIAEALRQRAQAAASNAAALNANASLETSFSMPEHLSARR